MEIECPLVKRLVLVLSFLMLAAWVGQSHSVMARMSILDSRAEMPRIVVGRAMIDAGPITAQSYALDDTSAGNGDGRADPGEAIEMTVTLVNVGEEPVLGVGATLSSTSPYVTLTHTVVITYGDLDGGETMSSTQPYPFQVSASTPRGQVATFTLSISAAMTGPWSEELTVPVGWWHTHLPLAFKDYVPDRIPNDEHYPKSWALPHIEAPKAWQFTIGDPSVIVAILDTGVDLDHPDLAEKLWINVDEVPGNGFDDDGNGFVDDVHGYDFWYDDPDPDDDHGHGTQVAGIAAAATDNEIGVASLGWNSSLMPLKTQGSNGWGTTNELIEAIAYAVDNGAHVVNVSVGQELTLCPAGLQTAIDYADAHGVLVVAAVGNQDLDPDKDFYPAACDNVLAVAATTSWDGRIGSDYGSYVDVAAPGHSIFTSVRSGTYGYNSGTSMATPLVSGLAALLYAHYPHYGDEEVAWAILSHVVDLGTPGKDVHYGWGRINAYRAVAHGATDAPEYKSGSEMVGRQESWGAFVPGELLVGWRTSSCTATMVRDRLFSSQDVRLLDEHPRFGIWRIAVPPGQERVYLETWRSDPCVAFVELNYFVSCAP